MAAKGRTVMDLLALNDTDTEFCLPSRLASHPTAWLVSINGLIYDARVLPLPIQAECARRASSPASWPRKSVICKWALRRNVVPTKGHAFDL